MSFGKYIEDPPVKFSIQILTKLLTCQDAICFLLLGFNSAECTRFTMGSKPL